MAYVLQPQAPTPRARSAANVHRAPEFGVAVNHGGNAINALRHHASGVPSPRTDSRFQAPVFDAEMSVEFLCQRFEAVSQRLRTEEAARESAERHEANLAAEVKSARQALTNKHELLRTELKAHDSTVDALKAATGDMGQHADVHTQRARATHAAGSRLERQCAHLVEECNAEVARRDRLTADLSDDERQYVQEQCMHSELARHLRQIHADVRVSQEDFRIVQQRLISAGNERDALAARVEITTRSIEELRRMSELQRRHLSDSCRQLDECEANLHEALGQDGMLRAEHVRLERQVSCVQDEGWSLQTRVEEFKIELHTAEREEQTVGIQKRQGEDVLVRLTEELRQAETRKHNAVREAGSHHYALTEAESSHRAAKRNEEQADATRATLAARHFEFVQEEEHHASSAASVRRSRHTEDLMFEDVQSELKATWRRNEALAEELGSSTRRRNALVSQLQRLRPEVRETDEQCSNLEDSLARNARDLEDVLVQQRHSRRESSALMESIRELQRHEMRVASEADMAARHEDFGFASGSRTPRGLSPPPCARSRGATPRSMPHPAGPSASSSHWHREDRISSSPSRTLLPGRRDISPAGGGPLQSGARPLVEPAPQGREDSRRRNLSRERLGHGSGSPSRATSPDSPPTTARVLRHGGPGWFPLQPSLAQPPRHHSLPRPREWR